MSGCCTVVGKGFWTPHAVVMYHITLRISLTSPSTVYFSAAADIDPHAAGALSCPAQSCTFQQDDSRELQEFSFPILSLSLSMTIIVVQSNVRGV